MNLCGFFTFFFLFKFVSPFFLQGETSWWSGVCNRYGLSFICLSACEFPAYLLGKWILSKDFMRFILCRQYMISGNRDVCGIFYAKQKSEHSHIKDIRLVRRFFGRAVIFQILISEYPQILLHNSRSYPFSRKRSNSG